MCLGAIFRFLRSFLFIFINVINTNSFDTMRSDTKHGRKKDEEKEEEVIIKTLHDNDQFHILSENGCEMREKSKIDERKWKYRKAKKAK